MPASTASSDARLATLSTAVKDYSGYGRIESRPQSDQAIRNQLISEIKTLIALPNDEINAADGDDQKRLQELVQSTKRKLETICQSLSAPTYQDAPFFSAAKLPARITERIYTLENQMLEETEHINTEFSSLREQPTARELFEDNFLHIKNFIDNINQNLFEREALILGDE